MTESTETPKETKGIEDAYKNEEEVSKVLDERTIDKSLLDKLPTPTGYRIFNSTLVRTKENKRWNHLK
jgi:hypothetical protein